MLQLLQSFLALEIIPIHSLVHQAKFKKNWFCFCRPSVRFVLKKPRQSSGRDPQPLDVASGNGIGKRPVKVYPDKDTPQTKIAFGGGDWVESP